MSSARLRCLRVHRQSHGNGLSTSLPRRQPGYAYGTHRPSAGEMTARAKKASPHLSTWKSLGAAILLSLLVHELSSFALLTSPSTKSWKWPFNFASAPSTWLRVRNSPPLRRRNDSQGKEGFPSPLHLEIAGCG